MKPHSKRRVPPPKESDFDHEINLVDHSAPVPRTASPEDEAVRSSTSGRDDAGPSSAAGPPGALDRLVDNPAGAQIDPIAEDDGPPAAGPQEGNGSGALDRKPHV